MFTLLILDPLFQKHCLLRLEGGLGPAQKKNTLIRKLPNIQKKGEVQQVGIYLHSPFNVIWGLTGLIFINQTLNYVSRFIKF